MEIERGTWATCLLTQLGFIRFSSNPSVSPTAVRPAQAADILARLTSDKRHVFLGDYPAPVDSADLWKSLQGYKQITDVWLLGTARRAGGKLLTFDAGLKALAPNDTNLEILRPSATR
jgi:predicted nucleic acid-binding protein